MQRVLVLLNAAAGTLAASSKQNESEVIVRRFATHGVTADVRAVPGDQLKQVATDARNSNEFDLVIAGGGDGTLNTVAGALVGGPMPFGVLPLGTFNHLAKELKLPLDLNAAIDALVTGRTVPFNTGSVNGQAFLLFAAIGFYSDMVRHRDAQRKMLGRRKMWAGAIAFVKMFFRWTLLRVTLRNIQPAADRASVTRLTTVVSISMSGYQLRQMGLAAVADDSRESMSVLVSPQVRRLGVIWAFAKGIFSRNELARQLELLKIDSVDMDVKGRSHIRVGYDGEVATMSLPLKIQIVRSGLMMRVPSEAPIAAS